MNDPFAVVWPSGLRGPLALKLYCDSIVTLPLSVPDTLVSVLAVGNLVNSAGAPWCVAAEKPDNKTIDSSDSKLGRRRYILRIMMQVLSLMERERSNGRNSGIDIGRTLTRRPRRTATFDPALAGRFRRQIQPGAAKL
jgi:hypothetical protein